MTLGIHHVAYRCNNAYNTILWYKKYLDLDFMLAISETNVPSTGERSPYMHIFLRTSNTNDNILAFFELPESPPMIRDPNTPNWVQHIALKATQEELFIVLEKLRADGIDVIGPIDHKIFISIYFFDLNGHRIELAYDTDNTILEKMDKIKWDMIKEWNETKTVSNSLHT